MSRSLVILVGGVAGAAAGIVAALLLAPSTGREVRQGLREGARTLGSAAQDGFEKSRLRVTDLMSSGSDLARQMRDRATEMGGTLREQAERMRGIWPRNVAEMHPESPAASKAPLDILAQAADALSKVQATLESLRRQTE